MFKLTQIKTIVLILVTLQKMRIIKENFFFHNFFLYVVHEVAKSKKGRKHPDRGHLQLQEKINKKTVSIFFFLRYLTYSSGSGLTEPSFSNLSSISLNSRSLANNSCFFCNKSF